LEVDDSRLVVLKIFGTEMREIATGLVDEGRQLNLSTLKEAMYTMKLRHWLRA